MRFFQIAFVGAMLGAMAAVTNVFGKTVTLSGMTFNRLSSEETLNPAFTMAGGETSANDYTGLVEVRVTGSGLNNVSLPDNGTDAFYNFAVGTNTAGGLAAASLRLGSETQLGSLPSGFAFSPNDSRQAEAGSLHVADLAIVYDGSSFSVSDPSPLDLFDGLAPVYSSSHEYHFVMDLGSYNGTLTLGFGDGGVSDNAGAYDISLWQVELVPEPSSWWILAVMGLSLLLTRSRA